MQKSNLRSRKHRESFEREKHKESKRNNMKEITGIEMIGWEHKDQFLFMCFVYKDHFKTEGET